MEIQDIRITTDNYQDYDLSPDEHWSGSIAWNNALDVQSDVHRFLDNKLDGYGSKDWAGKYATWLNNQGIEHQTDNGWWGEAAVSHSNLLAFIDSVTNQI